MRAWLIRIWNSKYPVFQSWLADKNLGTGINGMGLAIPQTNYMLNGSYLRIKNITIGYTLPARWTKKAHLNRVRIYVSGDNLFEWSGLKKIFRSRSGNQFRFLRICLSVQPPIFRLV